ncbi:hypothetical protein V6N13_147651 [Hibiscus sabdariffa]|uniref:K Homology domain-containing protein n=1 Tax=Hibiscus sabdariffa TaxID=183260 RepID=A0ABR2TW99_9ROSI
MTSSVGGGGRYMAFSPSPSAPHSPHLSGLRSAAAILDQEKYLSELLEERYKLTPFMSVIPHTCRLLNQEISRITTMLGNASVLGQSGLEHASPLTSGGMFSNGGADMNRWISRFQSEVPALVQPSLTENWLNSQGSSSGLIVKRTIRVDIPVDKYPNYNFVGRLLGPRGNSLKRVEANTECRVLIRGRGSIKDPAREEMMRGKPGYEHLNEPLHILVEAELPVEIVDARLMQAREILEDLLKPTDESQDFYKKQQLRELAMLNGTLREEGSPMSGPLSPFQNSLGMKRAKTRGQMPPCAVGALARRCHCCVPVKLVGWIHGDSSQIISIRFCVDCLPPFGHGMGDGFLKWRGVATKDAPWGVFDALFATIFSFDRASILVSGTHDEDEFGLYWVRWTKKVKRI